MKRDVRKEIRLRAMKLFSAQQLRDADQAAVNLGIPSLLLMEAAGRKVAEAALRDWPQAQVLVLCGKGNNGGDGYCAARHLLSAGRQVEVLELTPSADALSNDGADMRAALLAHGLKLCPLEPGALEPALKAKPLVIDALFGSGLSRPLEGNLATTVGHVGASGCDVLSVDVPSGVSADDGVIGLHIQATRTVQLAGPKLASVFYPTRAAFGFWEVADIGIPAEVLERHSRIRLLSAEDVRRALPERAADAHKYQVGTVLVIAGSARYQGAAELACRAACRAGAGLVTLAAEARLQGSWPEVVFEVLKWDDSPLEQLADIAAKRAQARVIGPGLDTRAVPRLPDLIGQSEAPTVLDAGALEPSEAWFAATRTHGRCVLTPHVGEAAHLLDSATSEVLRDPVGAVRSLSEKSGAICVLKGAPTLIAAPDGKLSVSTTGHPGMATGGAGDVLSGTLGAWLATADDLADDLGGLFERTCAAVYLHGLAGARAAETYGDGLVASDILEVFPKVWLAFRDTLSG